MEKELKPCKGDLLSADLTGLKRVGWPCPVRSAFKRTPVQDLNYFSIMLYYIISTNYQKIGDLFYLVTFLDFCTVCYVLFSKFLLSQLSNKKVGKC